MRCTSSLLTFRYTKGESTTTEGDEDATESKQEGFSLGLDFAPAIALRLNF